MGLVNVYLPWDSGFKKAKLMEHVFTSSGVKLTYSLTFNLQFKATEYGFRKGCQPVLCI